MFNMRSHIISAVCLAFAIIGCGGGETADRQVVIYTSVDQPYAEPILRDFEKQTGIRVIIRTDAEANKSVGLAERLRAEQNNPQADVWWGNEVFHTINLGSEGVLAGYESPSAGNVGTLFKDPKHLWTGTALRARVIAAASHPSPPIQITSLHDLLNPALKGKIAMARPTAGTTGGHVASLYVLWGEEKADRFFHDLRANDIKLLGGNSVVADSVGQGTILAGLTDNDDVSAAQKSGGKLDMILPDQNSFGTLTLPTTVALVAGARNPQAAKKMIDYLLTPQVEQRLIDAGFARWSTRGGGENPIKSMPVDYHEVAKIMPHAVRKATGILEGR